MILARLIGGWRRPAASLPLSASSSPRSSSLSLPLPVRSVSRSHVGRVRTVNEDRVLDRAAQGLWAVADGMGGHSAGDLAAQAVVDALRHLADRTAPIDAAAIGQALVSASDAIVDRAAATHRVSGSTVVALHIAGDRATLHWAGDSRAYRWRDGRIERLTRDHSLVQELIDAGAITPAQADGHPQAHVVTRALGATRGVLVEQAVTEARDGDLFLLCSDGLCRGAADPSITPGPIGTIADRLLADALAAGGADNVSLIAIGIGPRWQADETDRAGAGRRDIQ